jgi:hypothetical protein
MLSYVTGHMLQYLQQCQQHQMALHSHFRLCLHIPNMRTQTNIHVCLTMTPLQVINYLHYFFFYNELHYNNGQYTYSVYILSLELFPPDIQHGIPSIKLYYRLDIFYFHKTVILTTCYNR